MGTGSLSFFLVSKFSYWLTQTKLLFSPEALSVALFCINPRSYFTN